MLTHDAGEKKSYFSANVTAKKKEIEKEKNIMSIMFFGNCMQIICETKNIIFTVFFKNINSKKKTDQCNQ